ncbi:MAG: hypothetical protein ACOYNO_14070 [Saprospiraceae bacterium]
MYQTILRQLLDQTDDTWCVSIILPTAKGFQDHKMTDATLKGAFREAEKALSDKGAEKHTIQQLMEKLDGLAEGVDFASSEEGLGFFVNDQLAEKVDFSFPVDHKVVVDTSFEVRDLVYGAGTLEEYFVLMLNRHESKLYYALGKKMWDVGKHHADLKDLYVDAEWIFDKGNGDNDAFHTYLRQMDKNLGQYLNHRKLPVVVGGPEEAVQYFFNQSRHAEQLKGRIHGSFDAEPDAKLHEALEPILKSIRNAHAEGMKARLAEAEGHHKASQGVGNVWPLAMEGRVESLLVERGHRQTAYVHNNELHIDAPTDGAYVLVEDAVDDLIEMVLKTHGQVFFLPMGTFEPKVAALLRY